MKHFFLITNKAKDSDGSYTRRIAEYLQAHGATASCAVNKISDKEIMEIPENTECAIVLGGDGTLLKAARDMMDSDIPLLGVNLGTLGYLAEVEISNIESALDKLICGEYKREDRMMLSGAIYQTDGTEIRNFALNDIVISRCGSLQILQFDIFVNGKFLNSYSADGMIVATPTGSTGYNMSAGGPIVEPGAKLLLLTPICPHTLNTRSIILSPEDEVTIQIPENNGEYTEKTVQLILGSSY